MFDHLDDPTPPSFDDGVRQRVVARGRRHQRRTRLAAGGAVMAPCVAVGGFAVYLRSQVDQLEQIEVGGLVPATAPIIDPVQPLPDAPSSTSPERDEAPPIAVPINVLVAGVDRRPAGDAVTGSRADTIAVVRIDPIADRVAVLSLPRDLWVTSPDGESQRRINSFTEDGELVDVVSDLLRIDLNHYVEIDFEGFASLIDTAGGVSLTFDAPVRDLNTGFDAAAGTVDLSGADALAYVRSRKLEVLSSATGEWQRDPTSDLGRIERQQELMQVVYTTVFSQDFGRIDEFELLRDVVDDLTVDSGLDLDGVRAIFNAMSDIGSDRFEPLDISASVSGTVIQGQSVLTVDPDAIAAVVEQLLGDF